VLHRIVLKADDFGGKKLIPAPDWGKPDFIVYYPAKNTGLFQIKNGTS